MPQQYSSTDPGSTPVADDVKRIPVTIVYEVSEREAAMLRHPAGKARDKTVQ